MKVLKVILKILGALLAAYAALFAVFFFDLDGKLLYYVVEPLLCKHYERIERRDPMKRAYPMDKQNYDYHY